MIFNKMSYKKKILIWLISLTFLIPALIPGQIVNAQINSGEKAGNNPGMISYSPEPVQQLRIVFDYYHHTLPSTKVGNYMVTGSWVDDKGRYGWDDFVHSNTFDPVYTALGNDYRIFMGREPYSPKMLSQTDAVVLINADNPEIVPEAKRITDDEISCLQKFVKEGGSLMVMVNAGSSARASEGFEKVQLRKLVRGFGLDWNDVDTHYSDNEIPEGHSHFYDVPDFHYGAGCTLEILPEASKPEVLLDVYSDPSYTDREVRGHGIIMVRPGKGKFILVGDVGSWTGNISRPWADNVTILRQLFMYLKPDRGVVPPQLREGKSFNYEVTVSGLQAVPVANSLSGITRPYYKLFSPREITNMPYFERSADLQLTCKEKTKNQASVMEAKITDFRWFDVLPETKGDQSVSFIASRQGKVSGIITSGYDAQWLAPDIPVIIALLPVDGIRPGDRWKSDELLRVPVLRGSDLPPVKTYSMDIIYVGNTMIDGKNCRFLRSAGEIWLDDLGVTVEDLLPSDLIRQAGGSHYRFFKEHGGKLLFKREQWVDDQGIVIKARTQTRIIAWIRDLRKPIPAKNADKDNEMIVSLAHIVNFKLK
jgi:hypothetical protein